MNRIGVMQITDTLSVGGLEQMAVNLANSLPRDHYRSYLCSTRAEGDLRQTLVPHVKYLFLGRKRRSDIKALRHLIHYISENQIHLLHAHGTSMFIAGLASLFRPATKVVWHDHFGRNESEKRSIPLYRMAARAVDGIIGVTEKLVEWSRDNLAVGSDCVWYVPNFVTNAPQQTKSIDLPGNPGSRIVCVANLRPQKDHLNLLRAMQQVIRTHPEAHLILLGNAGDNAHALKIKEKISTGGLSANVSCLGSRMDARDILQHCDIGVLSSLSEGLPLALIEYGMAGLATVATRVGQCAEVVDEGRVGILVPPFLPTALAEALTSLLDSSERRTSLGQEFSRYVIAHYSEQAVLKKILSVYNAVLG